MSKKPSPEQITRSLPEFSIYVERLVLDNRHLTINNDNIVKLLREAEVILLDIGNMKYSEASKDPVATLQERAKTLLDKIQEFMYS